MNSDFVPSSLNNSILYYIKGINTDTDTETDEEIEVSMKHQLIIMK